MAQRKRSWTVFARGASRCGGGLDRLIHHEVIDFLNVHLSSTYTWPTFNFADSFIVVGVGLLLAEVFFASEEEPEEQPSGDDAPNPGPALSLHGEGARARPRGEQVREYETTFVVQPEISDEGTQSILERRLTRIVRHDLLAELGVEPEVAEQLVQGVDLRTVKVTESGSKEEDQDAGFFLAYALFLLLYLGDGLAGEEECGAIPAREKQGSKNRIINGQKAMAHIPWMVRFKLRHKGI